MRNADFPNSLASRTLGRYVKDEGSIYVIGMLNDKKDGHGTLMLANGKKYIGPFKNDQVNGYGSYYWPSGAWYQGGYLDGKYHGYGRYHLPSGEEREYLHEAGV